MRPDTSLPPAYFEDMFAGDPDPWRFETSAYEREKYDRTIAALGGRRYARALELGCANGVFTRRLAEHTQDLLALDVSESALSAARRRCGDLPNVAFGRMIVPGEVPEGSFDLMMIAEVAYYWDDGDLAAAGRWISGALRPGGDLALVHWIGETDYPQSGDEAVHKLAGAITWPMSAIVEHRGDRYRIDVWRRL